ncbi:MAG: acylneuraminate cytidylyltransferase family protein [Bacteroidetes bacterium HGW-Bacteroidetes-21]|nr:MAG: acylneuraminate cytidylyltransferase family protein [Bacteroidetes bacterium HGW-Bacteroidetes-21]
MKTLITICARGGSKGIPGKNIRQLNGKPLIDYTISVAKQFQHKFGNVDIVLSTDSLEIKQVAERCGLKSDYTRPEKLASDSAGKIDTIADVLLWHENLQSCKYDYILDLDVTSPLRNLQDLTDAFVLIQKNDKAVNLFSVNPAGRSPYFNMVEQKDNGFFAQVKKPEGTVLTRQSAPEVYDMNASFYFYKREFFEKGYKGAITDRSVIYIVPHTCFDLDNTIDFEFVSYLMENNKLDFSL